VSDLEGDRDRLNGDGTTNTTIITVKIKERMNIIMIPYISKST
jgi:hypothetical protein